MTGWSLQLLWLSERGDTEYTGKDHLKIPHWILDLELLSAPPLPSLSPNRIQEEKLLHFVGKEMERNCPMDKLLLLPEHNSKKTGLAEREETFLNQSMNSKLGHVRPTETGITDQRST